jgi:tetratricopeptide (TPR) repeat protein
LITYNYTKSVAHGKKLLAFDNCSASLRYNIHMWLAEAKCMQGLFQESLGHIDEAERISDSNPPNEKQSEVDSNISNLVSQVELKFRRINVHKDSNNYSSSGGSAPSTNEELLTVKIINKLNRCVVDICSGQYEKARQKFDEIITSGEENGGLGLKEITCDTDSTQMLPAYLISLLSYFYLRVKNVKMARAMVKHRRFVVDTDHLVQ